ncbi:3-deoxy-manno-octulosonate cytidylyltransferase [Niveispirillum cyanobacteriorum]|uniref:3-deoxy-manno-octulosonate cytidylyltransferase n=1 Tax=Niveispirillum cyanobacteriorum TaxID=1612173 RepID=A0A2K9NIC5_9PROT|nr:3-deoxy-manno-octulosonate cytidylyltransferase [Niveispirillum cyanobacteriorum]AUN32829.1 3-deoxy-manno-octulosonate cytidylyltransferase [Niveispirillum cyanobacteriorum]
MTDPNCPPTAAPVARPLVVIPARLGSTRLPDKPLADIHGAPMIVHVWRRAMEAGIGPVIVAAAEQAIVDAVIQAGGTAVLTDPDHPSGSDRVWEAVCRIDPEGKYDAIVNVQGDLPTIDPAVIRAVFGPLSDPGVDIATLGAVITEAAERTNPNVVKAVVEMLPGADTGRALYFTRATAPWGDGPLFHHIGLYAYRRIALERFVSLPPAQLEQREKLEQLRALANGMTIALARVDIVPLGVDTIEDLDRARHMLAPSPTP